MIFGLGVEKHKDRKYSLYKFTFMPLLDKKVTNQKKKSDEVEKKRKETDEAEKQNKTKQMKHNQKIINKKNQLNEKYRE